MSSPKIAVVGALILLFALAVALLLWARTRRHALGEPSLGLESGLRLVYTNHARERMSQRGVTRSQIEEVLARPHRRYHDKAQASMRFERDHDGRVLRVWVATSRWPPVGEAVIKTTAWQHHVAFKIDPSAKGRVIGRSGVTIRQMTEATATYIDVADDGTVTVTGSDKQQVTRAAAMVRQAAKR